MDLLLIVEIFFILFNLFFISRNILNRINTRKEGSFSVIRTFNATFFTTTIVSIAFLVYILIYVKDFNPLTKSLAIIIVILLFVNNFINTGILMGHNSFCYMYYRRNYKDIKITEITNKSANKLVTFNFKDGSRFGCTVSKNSGSTLLELLKRKSVTTKHNH